MKPVLPAAFWRGFAWVLAFWAAAAAVTALTVVALGEGAQ
jgi:hypothetical protein